MPFFRTLFWIWGPLGILTGALALVSIIVDWFGLALAPAPEGLLWFYRQTIDRLFQFSVEWWAIFIWPEFSIADPLKDLIAIYLLMVAVITRDGILRSRSANTNVMNNISAALEMNEIRQPFRVSAFGKAIFAPEFYWRSTKRLLEDLALNQHSHEEDSELDIRQRQLELRDILVQFSFMYLPFLGSVLFFVWNGILLRAP